MQTRLDILAAQGFDDCRYDEDDPSMMFVGCSQCQACCINGTPCHEQGCPNATRAKREAYEETNEGEE